MSFTGGFCILVILLLRLPLRRAPKSLSYSLWAAALFRLICPFSFRSAWSLLPSAAPVPRVLPAGDGPSGFASQSGLAAVDAFAAPFLQNTPPAAIRPGLSVFAWVWAAGAAAMLLWGALSLALLHRRLTGAVRLEKGLYLADHISSPFVLGLFSPKIYLPSGLREEDRPHILRHERVHIRRRDYLAKALAFFALCLHWFNPLVWVAFAFACRDMEASCDEAALRGEPPEVRAVYCKVLLSCSGGRHVLSRSPLAFGESGVKGRIQNLLSKKGLPRWGIRLCAAAAAAVCLGLMLNPSSQLTLSRIRQLARKGEALSWKDFDRYDGTPVGSGLYILSYPVKGGYTLRVGGPSPDEAPWYFYLSDDSRPKHLLDIRYGDIDAFVESSKQAPFLAEGDPMPPLLRVEGVLYRQDGGPMPAEIDPSAVLGEISSFVPENEIPTLDGQSNFALVGAPYARVEGHIAVRMGAEWYPFSPADLSASQRYRLQSPGSSGLPAPTLTLYADGSFFFSYDLLSSYLSFGAYEEKEGVLTARTEDGQRSYTWVRINKTTLRFEAGRSSPVPLTDPDMGDPVADGALFLLAEG